MRYHIVIYAWVALVCSTPGEQRSDITLSDGRILSGARILSHDPAAVVVAHAQGVDTIPFESLPEKLQEEFGYDASVAAEYRAEQVERSREAAARANREASERVAALVKERRRAAIEASRVRIGGKVMASGPDGVLVFAEEAEFSSRLPQADRLSRIGGFVGAGPATAPRPSAGNTGPSRVYGYLLIRDHPQRASLAIDMEIDVLAYPDGVAQTVREADGTKLGGPFRAFTVTAPAIDAE